MFSRKIYILQKFYIYNIHMYVVIVNFTKYYLDFIYIWTEVFYSILAKFSFINMPLKLKFSIFYSLEKSCTFTDSYYLIKKNKKNKKNTHTHTFHIESQIVKDISKFCFFIKFIIHK